MEESTAEEAEAAGNGRGKMVIRRGTRGGSPLRREEMGCCQPGWYSGLLRRGEGDRGTRAGGGLREGRGGSMAGHAGGERWHGFNAEEEGSAMGEGHKGGFGD